MASLHVKVISPERTLIDAEASEVTLQTKTGEITILPGHVPLVSELSHGDIVVKGLDKTEIAVIYGGFVNITPDNQVIILADAAEHLHELDEASIKAAQEKAKQAMDAAKNDEKLFAESEAELARISTQIRSLTKHSGFVIHKHKVNSTIPKLNDNEQ